MFGKGNEGQTAKLREAIAAVAQSRFDKEEARKKEAKAKHQRAKEAAKKEEEDELMAMKTAAAVAAEVLETKQEIKSAQAKEAARLAAEERAAREFARQKENLPEKNGEEKSNSGKETVTEMYRSDENKSAREVMALARQAREAARKAEDEKIDAMRREAAAKSEELERKESIRSAQAREAARLAAERRAEGTYTNSTMHFTPSTSQYLEEVQKMLNEKKRTGHHNKDLENARERDDMRGLTPTVDSSKATDREKEIVNASQTKHKSMEMSDEKLRYYETQEMSDPIEEYYMKQGGARPKERSAEYRKHEENSKSARNSMMPTSSTEQKRMYSYIPERDVVSATEDQRSGSRELNHRVEVSNAGKSNVMENYKHRETETVSVTNQSGWQRNYEDVNRRMEHSKITSTNSLKQNDRDNFKDYQSEHNRGDGKPTSGRDRAHDQDMESRIVTPLDAANINKGHEQQHRHSYTRNQQTPPNPHQHSSRQHMQRKPAYDPRILICLSCNKKYNFREKLPRYLYCGHTICTVCIGNRTNPDNSVTCPYCPKETYSVKNPKNCPIDEYLLQILSEDIQQGAHEKEVEGSSHGGSEKRQSRPEPWSDSSYKHKRMEHLVQVKSPHGSKCFEMGVRPSYYCSACKLWVCIKCAEIDHTRKMCDLKPLKDQLVKMKQKYDLVGQRTQATLEKSLQSLIDDKKTDDILILWMNAIFEGMEERLENTKNAIEEGRNLRSTLADVIKSVTDANNLPEALTSFEILESIESEANKWSLLVDMNLIGEEETSACIKSLLKRTLKSFMDQAGKPTLCATDKFTGGQLFSKVQVDGGRFHLPALTRQKPINKEKLKILPVQCFKSSQSSASTLVFLDLWWGNVTRGRVYIRMTGDTLRGRQFISLCTGDGGLSLRGTPFHRVWWKGKPGEHIWTGDVEKGDGSGGRSGYDFSSGQSQVPRGREVAVSAGLVAGRYEKNISSIFRIYTRESKGDKDEEGFGHVEFGLDVVKEAALVEDISDVIIDECGLVLEM